MASSLTEDGLSSLFHIGVKSKTAEERKKFLDLVQDTVEDICEKIFLHDIFKHLCAQAISMGIDENNMWFTAQDETKCLGEVFLDTFGGFASRMANRESKVPFALHLNMVRNQMGLLENALSQFPEIIRGKLRALHDAFDNENTLPPPVQKFYTEIMKHLLIDPLRIAILTWYFQSKVKWSRGKQGLLLPFCEIRKHVDKFFSERVIVVSIIDDDIIKETVKKVLVFTLEQQNESNDSQFIISKGITDFKDLKLFFEEEDPNSFLLEPFIMDSSSTEICCSICLENFNFGEPNLLRTVMCKHIFHKPCLDRWITSNKTDCPNCRQQLLKNKK